MSRRHNLHTLPPALEVEVLEGAGAADTWWDRFVVDAGGRLSQTSAWAAARAPRWSAARIVSTESEDGRSRPLGGAQIMTHRFRALGRVGYVDGGPIVVPGPLEQQVTRALCEHLADYAHHKRLRLLVVDPFEGSELVAPALAEAGFQPSRIKTGLPATVRVDLRRDVSEILGGMRTNTRRNIRRAEKAGVEVRIGTRDDIETVATLIESTSDRQHFTAPDRHYLYELYDRLKPAGRCAVFLSEVEGVPVSAVFIIIRADTAVYKRGGWNGSHADKRPNELLHWHVIQWAKEHGLSWYDFDGIEPDIARRILAGEHVEGQGVTRFKLGFGGEVFLLPGSVSYVPNRMLRYGYNHVFPRFSKLRPVKRALRRLRAG